MLYKPSKTKFIGEAQTLYWHACEATPITLTIIKYALTNMRTVDLTRVKHKIDYNTSRYI